VGGSLFGWLAIAEVMWKDREREPHIPKDDLNVAIIATATMGNANSAILDNIASGSNCMSSCSNLHSSRAPNFWIFQP
jgi:hypothetical protein